MKEIHTKKKQKRRKQRKKLDINNNRTQQIFNKIAPYTLVKLIRITFLV